ncbi:MAG: hypothetical protein RL263_778 [Bacteroidota bacterium]|jgi:uncharacterized protein YqeY
MNLAEKINEGIKEAMKAKDTDRLRALRGIKSAFLLLQTAEGVTEVTEEMYLKSLQKLAKQRKDSLEIYEQQNREDLAQIERAELKFIEEYLPAQLDEATVKAKIQEIITQQGVSGPAAMGKIMPLAMKELGSQADGKLISNLVKELLK